jgi:serine/threonine-protein kinase ULK/ATG1
VLEAEDDPLMRKPSAKKDVPADGGVVGLEGEERATVVKRKTT